MGNVNIFVDVGGLFFLEVQWFLTLDCWWIQSIMAFDVFEEIRGVLMLVEMGNFRYWLSLA